MKLEKVKIRRIIGPTRSGAAVLLGNDKKTFMVFVGLYEAAALIRAVNQEVLPRPLTHELIQSVFLGFDVEVKDVIISSIIENAFCATLVLQQKLEGKDNDKENDWPGRQNKVRIDARPSDCLVLAIKNKVDIHVTQEVFDQVQDVSKMTDDLEGKLEGMASGELEIDVRGESALEEVDDPPGIEESSEEDGEDDYENQEKGE